MQLSAELLIRTLDANKSQIAIADHRFKLLHLNKAWCDYENSVISKSTLAETHYLDVWTHDSSSDLQDAILISNALEDLRKNIITEFNIQYQCQKSKIETWFYMEITQFKFNDQRFFLISKHEVTEQVVRIKETFKIARSDSLTGIANRRAFDDFIQGEWSRCRRSKSEVSIAIVDLDNFKHINDSFGHQIGDRYLKAVASILKKYTGRESDICARYGGDEFIIAWGSIGCDEAVFMAEKIIQEIRLINCDGKIMKCSSASIGLCSVVPGTMNIEEMISGADVMLYKAKRLGKNRVFVLSDLKELNS